MLRGAGGRDHWRCSRSASYAAPITASSLAEVPLQGLNPVKPNIMFTLDDSGSMEFVTLPDYVTTIAYSTRLKIRAMPTVYAAVTPYTGLAASQYAWCLGNGGKLPRAR